MANVVMMGNIHTVDNPKAEGSDSHPVETKYAILIGVYLPDKNVIYLGGVDSEGKSLYQDQISIKK